MEIRFVKGGSSLRTSRGSIGVRRENCGVGRWIDLSVFMYKSVRGMRIASSIGAYRFSYQLGNLDKHPIVCAIREQLKELWCKAKQALQGVFPASCELEHDIDSCRHDGGITICQTAPKLLNVAEFDSG